MTTTAVPPGETPGLDVAPGALGATNGNGNGSGSEHSSHGTGPVADPRLHSLRGVLAETTRKIRQGHVAGAQVWPTGFEALDTCLGGGVRSGELVLLGGPHGLGKTTMALQMLHRAVASGRTGLLFSFEHDAHAVLERLLVIEAVEWAGSHPPTLTAVRRVFESHVGSVDSLEEQFAQVPGGVEAVQALHRYGHRLHIHTSSAVHTTTDEIRAAVERVAEATGQPPFVLVDYLQKVPASRPSMGEDERITAVVEQLKDLALTTGTPVVAIVAADKASLAAGKRMRVHDLRGSSALAYEADVVLMLNDKYDIVARHHLVYHLEAADQFRQWVVLTIEKNRSGIGKVELEFHKRFEYGRFDPHGRPVAEQLIEERVFVE